MAKDHSLTLTGHHLWHELDPDTGFRMPRPNVLTIRVSDDLVERIDALQPIFEQNANLCSTGRSSRSDIVRRLLLEALAHYEGEAE